jgi:alternate signal-mediated exported protein
MALVGIVASGIVALLLAAIGGTRALWSDDSAHGGGVITAGDLYLKRSDATWKQVTPGVAKGASGTLTGTPPDVRLMPGDVIELTLPVTATLRGDNLNGAIAVEFTNVDTASKAVQDGLISAGFHVADGGGRRVAPPDDVAGERRAPVGSTLAVPGLVGNNDGTSTEWSVVVTVEVLGGYRWVTDTTNVVPVPWAVDGLTVRLAQVRAGEGFLDSGGAP